MFRAMWLMRSGPLPVLGKPGAPATTMEEEVSIAVKPLACPLTVPILVVVPSTVVWHVNDHDSLLSNRLFLLRSPGCPTTRPGSPVHLSSVTVTLLNGSVPGLVTVYE